MAIGLPIITTPVGGINDFFIEEKMGLLIQIRDIQSIVDKVEQLYLNIELRKLNSDINIDYASRNFKGAIVFDKLNDIIRS
jgi:glycosyltransferase involved in cell wall biosynthesis